MSLSSIAFNQIVIMFIIIAIGIICYKVKLIDEVTNEKLSNLLLMLVNPIVIFVSYQRDFNIELIEGLLISLLLAFITHLMSILVSYLLIRKKKIKIVTVGDKEDKRNFEWVKNEDVEVERMSVIYANVGFMGIPLINGIFGAEGVFYVTASITVFNIFLWTHGVIVMSSSDEKIDFKSLGKKLLSPSIIAIILGLIFFLAQIRVPKTAYDAFNHIASINTPFAMLIAGVAIGKTNIIKLIKKIRVYYIAILKLLIIPILLILIYSKFGLNEKVFITAVLMAGMPAATTTILFSIKYNKNAIIAAEIFTITTLLCAITIPIIVTISELFV